MDTDRRRLRSRGPARALPGRGAERRPHSPAAAARGRDAVRHAAVLSGVEDYAVDGTTVPAGDRVPVIFASANRDERRYAEPERFDVTRDARDHVGFGHGAHRCAGAYLAQLEMQCLLRAMVTRVRRIVVDEPAVAFNNVLRGYRGFRAAFHG